VTVTVIVPWRAGCPYREAAWAWTRARYAEVHESWIVVEASATGEAWCKGAAVNAAVDAAAPGTIVVADADVWCTGLPAAVDAVRSGAAWAIPHLEVHRLAQDATDPAQLDQAPYVGLEGGGLVIADRATLREIPLDERFTGWGQEDQAWAQALTTLAGPPWRGLAPLLHRWHPPAPRATRRVGSPEGKQLFRRYLAARNDPRQMRDLLKEARSCPSPPSSTCPAASPTASPTRTAAQTPTATRSAER
jgi:hypothetical protein